MPKYVIERDIPGVGKLTPSELMGISQKSCSVLAGLGPQIQWPQLRHGRHATEKRS